MTYRRAPRRRLAAALAAAVASALLLGGPAAAHVRLRHPGNGNPLYWAHPSSVSIVLNASGSDDLPPFGHFPALRGAIAAWSGASGSSARLVENVSPAQQARVDWPADNLHLVLFDEDDGSGYFPDGSATVALTPVWFGSSGAISDADVLFNGQGFAFTTSGEPGAFDVEDVAAHELGHLVGLDHSGWAGATMYPYVDPSIVLHRSLSLDEVHGLRDAYPASPFATIQGAIERASNAARVPGAHVVAVDASGRSAASALADGQGAFRLRGLDAGTYALWAAPLDHPVSAANLSSGHVVETDFAATALGTFSVSPAETLATGDLAVLADVALSLGRNVDAYPLRCVAGEVATHTVRGSGLAAGSTLEASDPALVVTPLAWLGNQVVFQVEVPPDAADGHADLVVENAAGERSLLVAALELTPPDPLVDSVSPPSGDAAGGTVVTVRGSGFRAGMRVALGGVLYADGAPQGCLVVDDGTLRLLTRPSVAGVSDVVVLDPSGVEGRAEEAFLFADLPDVESLFPVAGSAAGGTEVVIRGSGFAAGCEVRIDGVAQASVTLDDPTRLVVVTGGGVPGGPYVVEVENPGGGIASSAFSYVAAPDPGVAAIEPAQGSKSGGETVVVRGFGFAPGSTVLFGADPDLGTGGAPAAAVTWVDAQTLEVVTPPHASGPASVIVLDPASGQAAVVDHAFTFTGGGGGGGGCGVVVPTPRDPAPPASALLGIAVAAAWALASRRRGRTPATA